MYQGSINGTVVRVYDDDFPLLMPSWGYVAAAFVLFLIGFFGFFLNLLVILLMFKDRQLWTPLNIILFNLVCSDFSVSVLGNPFTLTSALFHRWVFGHTMCVMYGFFMALLGIVSITSLTVLAFERYMLISRPLNTRHLSARGAAYSIVFIWSYSLALTTPPLMGWGNYVNEAANISCSVNWHEQSLNTLTYILYLFAMGLIIPMAVITYSYINVVRTMKQNSQRLGRESRAEAKVTTMVLIMIIAFTVAWTPYAVFALLEQFSTDGIISPGAGVIPALVAKSSICYDPLIYVGMNTQFRQSIKRLFGLTNKSGYSQTEKGVDNTLVSPSHRITRTTDIIRMCNNFEIVPPTSPKQRLSVVNGIESSGDDSNEKNEQGSVQEKIIVNNQHIKTISDAEPSDQTVLDDDSSHENKKSDASVSDCYTNSNNSPTLRVFDSRKQVLCTRLLIKEDGEDSSSVEDNVYGNNAFESHPSDVINEKEEFKMQRYRKIKQSLSLDLSSVPSRIPTKFSVELNLDDRLHKETHRNIVVIKKCQEGVIFKKSRDNFKTYFFVDKGNVDEDIL